MTWQLVVLIADMTVLIGTMIVAAYGIRRVNWDFAHSMYVLEVDVVAYRGLTGTARRLSIREWLNWDFTRYMK